MKGQKEKLFYDMLNNIFIGAKIEGDSGYVNLMRIKSNYYNKVFEEIGKEINKRLNEFPEFREEMFNKLYSFFKTYFNEAGAIYFNQTPLKSKVYEKVYSNNKDVILFWKTHMLYYVKTDKLWNNLKIEFDNGKGDIYKVSFNVSELEHKKANEKKSVIYELSKINNNDIMFNVLYSERGKKTKINDILKEFKKKDVNLDEEQLKRIFRIFERQNEVDYFINKNAEQFLKEHFDLYLKNYIFDDESIFDEKRLKELKSLKEIAYMIIDFIAQFEDELVRIWNKPKFVLNSNYVITLDRIYDKNGIDVIEYILNAKGIEKQIEEWKELGFIDNDFKLSDVFINTLAGKSLNPKYQFLPVDTKYFDEDVKFKILMLFGNLDDELDGWLIKSENYQALNTILPKFRDKVQTIYIDPPFNLGTNADFLYDVSYKDATWITILENRIRLGKDLLNNRGCIFVRCDYNGNAYVRLLMNEIFGEENFRNEILINRKRQSMGTPNKFEVESEYLYLYSKNESFMKKDLYKSRSILDFKWTGFLKQGERNPKERVFFGKTLYPPKNQHFSLIQEKVDKLIKEHYLRLKCKKCRSIYYWDESESKEEFISKILKNRKESFKYLDIKPDTKVYGISKLDKCLNCGGDDWKVEYLTSDKIKITDNWKDIASYSDNFKFSTENSEIVLKRVIQSTSNEGDLILDFFCGSGTTIATAHKLKRKWIGIEMGEHFYTVILPRMKKVLFYDKSGISKEKDVKDIYNKDNTGGFFKYYELEQYEHTLKKAVYEPSEPLMEYVGTPIHKQYVFLKDKKFLDALELDYENNKTKINWDTIYKNIDLAETLSNLTGRKIKRIAKDYVILENDEKIEFDDIDFKLIKPLIWW